MDKATIKNKKNLIWLGLFICIVLGTIYAITSQSKTFTLEAFGSYVLQASPLWLTLAFVSMLGFILFEALALLSICRSFDYRRSLGNGLAYSAADILFSAITPSASGGQPAAAYLMSKDRLPVPTITVALLLNLAMYTVSLLVIGCFCLLIKPEIFACFNQLSQVLIVLGLIIQGALVVLFLLLIFKERIVLSIADGCLKILNKLHLVRNRKKWHSRLLRSAREYKRCAAAISIHKKMLAQAFLCNMLQRISLIFVSVCTYLAAGGSLTAAADAWLIQGLVMVGSNAVPVPGAVGVADYMLLDGFGRLVSDPVCFDLLSRGISFYFCLAFCVFIVLSVNLLDMIRQKRRMKQQDD